MIYFENEAARLLVLPEKNLAVTQWSGFATSNQLHELLDKSLELIEKYTIYYWLSDNRNMKVVRPADQEFIVQQWLPMFLERCQVKKSVTIQSEDIFSKMSVESMRRKADHLVPFDSETVLTFAEAVDWLGIDLKEEDLEKIAA